MSSDRAVRPRPRRRAGGGRGRSHPLSSLLFLLLALLAAPAAALDTIYLVRHAEKEEWPPDPEISTLQPLSPEGVARAQTLATRLKDAGIAAVYASRTTRALHTGLPLARAANVPLIADDATIKPDRMAAFLSTLRAKHAQDRAVLIVGHSNTIPELLIQLGAKPECFAKLGITGEPGALLTEGYEGVWRVDVKGEGRGGIVRE